MACTFSLFLQKIIDNMNRICNIFGIKYPIIAGGMVWCSGWKLAFAVCQSGGLGLIGAGSMTADLLREHISKLKQNLSIGSDSCIGTWGVNLPMMKPNIDELVRVVIEEKVPVAFTSAGNPKKYTQLFHENGIKVVHVVSSSKFALKCVEAGVDAIVAEGFEAGGHDGKEESTTMTLIPQVADALKNKSSDAVIPLIAAGGIASGRAMMAAFALGAEGVQVGTAFALSEESGASEAYKKYCTNLNEGDTMLILKKLSPTRMAKNEYFSRLHEAEKNGAAPEELLAIIGAGRTKLGIFDGDLVEGELEIGQIASAIKTIKPVKQIVDEMIEEYNQLINNFEKL